MNDLPRHIDWPRLLDNIRGKAGIRMPGIARAAKLHITTVGQLHSRGDNPRYETAAPLINLHRALLPDVPIPER